MSGPTQLPLPKPDAAAIPAAAYVRMSTEHQQYSTENQLDRIKEYAARRGMEIVRVFEDSGNQLVPRVLAIRLTTYATSDEV